MWQFHSLASYILYERSVSTDNVTFIVTLVIQLNIPSRGRKASHTLFIMYIVILLYPKYRGSKASSPSWLTGPDKTCRQSISTVQLLKINTLIKAQWLLKTTTSVSPLHPSSPLLYNSNITSTKQIVIERKTHRAEERQSSLTKQWLKTEQRSVSPLYNLDNGIAPSRQSRHILYIQHRYTALV